MIQIQVVFPRVQGQGGHIDRHMQDTEECQRQHGRNAFGDGSPMNLVKLWKAMLARCVQKREQISRLTI